MKLDSNINTNPATIPHPKTNEGDTPLMPPLSRDLDSSVAETLKRLKTEQNNHSPEINQTTIKTAGTLPSQSDIDATNKRRLAIIGIIILIVLTLSILAITRFVGFSPNLPVTLSGAVQTNEIAVPINAITDQLANLDSTRTYISFYVESEEEVSNHDLTNQVFSAFGIELADEFFLDNVSKPLLVKDRDKFALAVFVREYPIAVRSLRLWEPEAGNISTDLVSGNQNWQIVDESAEGLDFRSFTAEGEVKLTYTIENNELVLIGSDPQFVSEVKDTLRSRIYSL